MSAKRILFSEQQIQNRIQKLAQQITTDYKNQELTLLCILKGSFILTADLLRALYEQGKTDVVVEFLTISSYGAEKESSKEPQIIGKLPENLRNTHLIIIEDIVDTGYTVAFVKKLLEAQKPASVKLLTLLDKKAKREVPIEPDYSGFSLNGSPWVEGYGLDTGELGRGNPDIIDKSS